MDDNNTFLNIQDETFPQPVFDELDNLSITPENLKLSIESGEASSADQMKSTTTSTFSSGNFSMLTENELQSSEHTNVPISMQSMEQSNQFLADPKVEPKGKSQSCNDLFVKPSLARMKGTSSAQSLSNPKPKRKYDHVQSKVKILIEDLQKNDREKRRKMVVKSKSMPFPNKSQDDEKENEQLSTSMHDEHNCRYMDMVHELRAENSCHRDKLADCQMDREKARTEIEKLRDANEYLKKLCSEHEKRTWPVQIYNQPIKSSKATQTESPMMSPISINQTSFQITQSFYQFHAQSASLVNDSYHNNSTELLVSLGNDTENVPVEIVKRPKIGKRIKNMFRGCINAVRD